MPKQGMRRPDPKEQRNGQNARKRPQTGSFDEPVPEIQGKAKSGDTKAEHEKW